MGSGPALQCSKCGRTFFGGKGYQEGVKNYCYECIVPMAKAISKYQYEELGQTQRGLINMARDKEMIETLGGEDSFIKSLKVNAGELPKETLEDIDSLYVDSEGDSKEYDRLSVKGEMAMIDKDYASASQLFLQLAEKYPDEGAPYIRLCRAISKGESAGAQVVNVDREKILNKAEQLIKTGVSKYPMDKFNGLGSLHFEKGIFYVTEKGAYSKAVEEFEKALGHDPDFEDARIALELAKKKEFEYSANSNPTSTSSSNEQKSGCFIATAVYGCDNDPNVLILRTYKDNILLPSRMGKLLVNIYYMISPSLAKVISSKLVLRNIVRKSLVQPIVNYVAQKSLKTDKGSNKG